MTRERCPKCGQPLERTRMLKPAPHIHIGHFYPLSHLLTSQQMCDYSRSESVEGAGAVKPLAQEVRDDRATG